jgi:hypothetical protein
MSIPYESVTNGFQTAKVGAGTYIEYPFTHEGDTTAKIYHIICDVYDVNYSPIGLDTVLSGSAGFTGLPTGYANSSAYHIGDFNKQKLDGGLVRFDRRFATIPATRSNILTGTTAYTYPGMANSAGGTTSTITGLSGNNTVIASTSAEIGSTVSIQLTTEDSTGITLTSGGDYIALAGTGSGQVVVAGLSSLGTFVSGSVTVAPNVVRKPLNLSAGSFTTYTYSKPDNYFDVTLSAVFKPSSLTLTSGTVPTATGYQALIDDLTATGYLTISSEVTKYAGNIVQKADVKIKAL